MDTRKSNMTAWKLNYKNTSNKVRWKSPSNLSRMQNFVIYETKSRLNRNR